MRRLGEAALVKSLCRPGSLLFRLACDLEAAEVLLRVLKSCCHKSCAHQRCDTSCNPTPPKYIYVAVQDTQPLISLKGQEKAVFGSQGLGF